MPMTHTLEIDAKNRHHKPARKYSNIIIIIIINAFESEALAVTRWAAMVRVLMGYLKRRVFRRRLKVSKVGKNLILRGSPFQTVGAK